MPIRVSSFAKRPVFIAAAAVVILGASGASLALGASHQVRVHPDTTVSYTGTTAGAIVQGVQKGTGVGVEGVGGTVNGSIGILGVLKNTATDGVGLEGLVWGPSSTGLYGQGLKNTDTTHPTVGLLGTSTSGIGVEGESLVAAGTGVEGIADDAESSGQVGVNGGAGIFGTNSRNNMLFPGVDGESTVQGGPDAAGGFGLDFLATGNAPDDGALAYAQQIGYEGTIVSNGSGCCPVGVFGEESTTAGSSAALDFNDGVLGDGRNGTGVAGIAGGDGVNLAGFGSPIGGYFAGHESANSVPANVGNSILAEVPDTGTTGFQAYDTSQSVTSVVISRGLVGLMSDTGAPYGAGFAGDLLDGFGANLGTTEFQFTSGGNLNIAGTLTSGASPRIAPRTQNGSTVQEYGARTTMPDIEDFGEGQLAQGAGYVRIDAALANAIDRSTNYLVFITPEGDSNGLYVTAKSPDGFAVRENAGGRHTLAFSYRIVAKPFDESGPRLAVVRPMAQRVDLRVASRGHRDNLDVDAFANYVKHVGWAQAERELQAFKASVTSRALMTTRLPHADSQGNLKVGNTVVQPNPNP